MINLKVILTGHEVYSYYYYPEFGFTNREDINTSGDLNYKKICIQGTANINLVVPLGYYSSIELG